MDRREKGPTAWHIKAALPLTWRAPIRAAAMTRSMHLEEWVKEALREKAERDGIQLPKDDVSAEESEDDAA